MSSSTTGLRCAEFHIDPRSDDPGPRCGHTLTCVPAEGGGQRLIVFGGATALEGDGPNGSSSGIRTSPTRSKPASHLFFPLRARLARSDLVVDIPPPDDASSPGLAGATSDVHSFDVRSGVWSKLEASGEGPSPRAAHSAAAVGNMVVVQGGIGPAGLASEDLHVLDLQGAPRWHRVVVRGPGPGQRYAHVISFVAQRFLVVHGGNDGSKPLGDSWCLDTTNKPYEWVKMNPSGDIPPPRMYAAAAPRADGLLLLCGGRGADSAPLSDAFGLARHRDGRWEWAAAPGEAPTARYQHAVSFVGTRLHVSGGALGGGSMVDDSLSLAVLNTSAGPAAGWSVTEVRARESPSAGGAKDAAAAASRRCRHTTAGVGPLVFTCGGLRGGTLLGDMYVSEEPPSEAGMTRAEATLALAEVIDLAAPAWQRWLRDVGLLEEAARATATLPLKTEAEEDDVGETFGGTLPRTGTTTSSKTGTSGVRSGSGAFGTPQGGSFAVNTPGSKDGSPENNLDSLAKLSSAEARAAVALAHRTNVDIDSSPESAGSGKRYVTPSPGSSAGKKHTPSSVRPPLSSDVRLHHRAVVVAAGLDGTGPTGLGSLVRQLSIDQFESESKRIGAPGELATPARMGGGDPGLMTPNTGARGGYTPEDPEAADSVHKRVINKLLLPRSWEPPADRSFILNADEIDELCLAAEEKFKQEPTVLKLRAPTKIFGDLHGQFGDLMRLFAEYGSPSTVGDIAYIDYLFLGDYVDRGAFSLETMSLLLALKVEYPDSVHLLRGNHEEADINALFGFRIECIDRLGEAAGVKAWNRFNDMFQWLPLAAVIEDRVACMHGGIGRSVTHISQLEELERPLTMESGGMMLMDVLWSDPTESDKVEGLRPNARGPGLVTFGPDRVRKFCEDNDLQMIIRAHECVMDGFERFAGGLLITVFSATNYCGTANNAGAILVLGRDLTLYPKLIHPLPPSALYGSAGSIDEDMDGPWQMGLNKERPPTPPRGRGDGRGRPTGAVA